MKNFKILTALFAFFLFPASLFSEEVSLEKARQIAETFFGSRPLTRTSSSVDLKMVWDGGSRQTKGPADAPTFYVFDNASALLKDYVLGVTHMNRIFRLPEFTGTLKSGTVNWGDGSQEGYSAGLEHDYGTESEVTVEMNFNAGAGEHLVKFDDIEGIVEIDLSGM